MGEWLAGQISDFYHDGRSILKIDGREVVVLRYNDRFYAIANTCLHMGGPVGEGMLMGKVEAVLTEDNRCLGERFSEEEMHIVCPWHGWEYSLESGEFAGDRKRRLPTFEVTTRGDKV